jgi:hypothetical protein
MSFGTSHVKKAVTFVNEVIDPLNQLGQAYDLPYGPTNKLLAPVIGAYPDLVSSGAQGIGAA